MDDQKVRLTSTSSSVNITPEVKQCWLDVSNDNSKISCYNSRKQLLLHSLKMYQISEAIKKGILELRVKQQNYTKNVILSLESICVLHF